MTVILRAKGDAKKKQEQNENPKARRRRLYKVLSEEKPNLPMKERNFHGMVMENKEIIKMVSMLSTCIQDIRQVIIYHITSTHIVSLIKNYYRI